MSFEFGKKEDTPAGGSPVGRWAKRSPPAFLAKRSPPVSSGPITASVLQKLHEKGQSPSCPSTPSTPSTCGPRGKRRAGRTLRNRALRAQVAALGRPAHGHPARPGHRTSPEAWRPGGVQAKQCDKSGEKDTDTNGLSKKMLETTIKAINPAKTR